MEAKKIWHGISEAPKSKEEGDVVYIIAVMDDGIHVEQFVFDSVDYPWEELLQDSPKIWKWAYQHDVLAELYKDNESKEE